MRLELWCVDVFQHSDILESAERALSCLSAEEIKRAESMTLSQRDCRAWRAAHIALRLVLERWLGAGVRGQAWRTGSAGRPELEGGALSFSLSHAGEAALIGLCDRGPIGVDIERLRPITINAERRALLAAYAGSLNPGVALPVDPEHQFLQAWVRLEAVAKADGGGIGRPLAEAGMIGPRARAGAASLARFAVRDLSVGIGSFAAVAAPELPAEALVRRFPDGDGVLLGLLGGGG